MRRLICGGAMLLAMVSAAAAQPRDTMAVGTIRFREAMLGTREGRKAVTNLQARFDPRKAQLEMKRKSIEELQNRVRQERLTDQQRAELARKIQEETRTVQRFADDLENDAQRETEAIEKFLSARMDAFLAKFAEDRGLAMVLDTGAAGNPVRWVKGGVDITADVVRAYDAAGGA